MDIHGDFKGLNSFWWNKRFNRRSLHNFDGCVKCTEAVTLTNGNIRTATSKSIENRQPEVKDLKSGNNASQSLAVAALKHESVTQSRVVAKLENESIAQSLAVADLKNEFKEKSTRLQNSYDILQKKFDSLQKENNVLEHDNAALKSQIADYHNISIHTKQELDFFTHSIPASNIQNVTTIQSSVNTLKFQMKTLNTRLYSLSSISTSRSQDFLALLNKTNVADLKLESIDNWSKSFQNYTENKLFGLDSFVQNYALDNTTTTNRLHSLEQNYALFSKEIGTVNGKIQELDQHGTYIKHTSHKL
ncbi:unnamed protein product [Mytilus edulis]|uniref:Uncharacterized protein n=1 Tax=Mytilus edulis TaxID=6550 RepID=A0A8S3VBR0_MYTED|nr:unnamed protein product [Mytilus edulis]